MNRYYGIMLVVLCGSVFIGYSILLGSLKACEDNTTASAKCGIYVCRWGTCIMRPCPQQQL